MELIISKILFFFPLHVMSFHSIARCLICFRIPGFRALDLVFSIPMSCGGGFLARAEIGGESVACLLFSGAAWLTKETGRIHPSGGTLPLVATPFSAKSPATAMASSLMLRIPLQHQLNSYPSPFLFK
jgi:hypothetical protein